MALTLATGCKGSTKHVRYSPGEVGKVLNVDTATLKPAIAVRIEGNDRPAWVTRERWTRVRGLYKAYGNAPLWLEEGGVKERASALLGALREAPDHGLDTTAYPIAAIERVVDAKRLTDTASAATLGEADVLLTSAYVAYAADMLIGQVDPKTVSQAWHIPAGGRELDTAIVRGIEATDMKPALDSMAPQNPDYQALKAAYARYRTIAASGGWQSVSSATAPADLKNRLDSELAGDSSSTPGQHAVDSTAVPTGVVDSSALPKTVPSQRRASRRSGAAVADGGARVELTRFQERHGLEKTGKLDRATLEALNVPAEDRAKQIAANLERHRWLPRALGTRYIFVNVPAFRLDAYDSGQKQLTMKVVVGQEYEGKVTPVFSDTMESVVFRPYWNITPDIQAKETGPKAAADPGYLERNDMEYYKDGGATRIRQRPGGKNSLGLVKFLFPNSFNIYLHDTPAKELFNKTDRAASHGCIRLEKPAEMAQWVLGWDAARVQQAMNSGSDNSAVRVPQKLPVYIVYFTAYIRDGQLFFGDDVYNRDASLANKVAVAPKGT
ncbi:MAG: L,D-transpeptidase family protein [Gemmatimonadota bacterium]|nr:L,D-transpeptidase family protein [Gemmatimonadota bacterium]